MLSIVVIFLPLKCHNYRLFFQFRLFQLFVPILAFLGRNMGVENTFLSGKDFSASTTKQLSLSNNKVFARELF